MIYKLYKSDPFQPFADAAMTVNFTPESSFMFSPSNPSYQQFKLDLTNGAELQEADGNVMTAEQVQAFMETLP